MAACYDERRWSHAGLQRDTSLAVGRRRLAALLYTVGSTERRRARTAGYLQVGPRSTGSNAPALGLHPSYRRAAGQSAAEAPADISNRLRHPSHADLATHRRYSIRPASPPASHDVQHRHFPPQNPAASSTGRVATATPGGAGQQGRVAGLWPHGGSPTVAAAPLSPGGRRQSTKQFSCCAECIRCGGAHAEWTWRVFRRRPN